MKSFLFIGNHPFRRGLATEVMLKSNPSWIRNKVKQREAYEVHNGYECEFDVAGNFPRFTGGRDTSVVFFRDVSKHTDDWDKVRSVNGKYRASGFLHQCIKGEFDITVGRNTYHIQKGDVFLMNPNVSHSVKTNSRMCATLVQTVPMGDTLKAFEKQTKE